MTTQWHYRDGQPVEAGRHVDVVSADQGKVVKYRPCGRCGGAGGSEKWRHTGWKCYDCGGSGQGDLCAYKVYSADKLAKLNATAAKRQATKVANAAEAEAAKRAAGRELRRKFFADFGRVLLDAYRFRKVNLFLADMVARAWTYGQLTAAQVDALYEAVAREWEREAKRLAEAARKLTARHVGTVGERIMAELTVVRRIQCGENAYGPVTLKILRDAEGNSFKTFGTCRLREGETATVKATVTAHERYGDEPQTVISRLAIL